VAIKKLKKRSIATWGRQSRQSFSPLITKPLAYSSLQTDYQSAYHIQHNNGQWAYGFIYCLGRFLFGPYLVLFSQELSGLWTEP